MKARAALGRAIRRDREGFLRDTLAILLENRVRPLFRKPANAALMLTVIIREPGNPEGDILVTQDTLEQLQAVLVRSATREDV